MLKPKISRPVPHYRTAEWRSRSGPKTFAARAWAFLNTPLGLLLVSAVILGGLGRLYADHQSDLQALQKNREERENVALELTARMSRLSNYVRWIGDIDYLSSATHPEAFPDQQAYGLSMQCMKAKLAIGPVTPGYPKTAAEIPDYPSLPRIKLQQALTDILLGKDSYEATSPEFQKVQMSSLLLRMDQLYNDKLGDSFMVSKDEPGIQMKSIVDQIKVSDAVSALEEIDDSCLSQLFLEKLGWYMQVREGGAICVWEKPKSRSPLAASTCHPIQISTAT